MFNSMFDESKEVKQLTEIADFKNLMMTLKKYFQEIKRLKSLQKAEVFLEPKQASMVELFCEYTSRLTIFAIRPLQILKFSK